MESIHFNCYGEKAEKNDEIQNISRKEFHYQALNKNDKHKKIIVNIKFSFKPSYPFLTPPDPEWTA